MSQVIEHKPYISADQKIPEFTLGPIIIGTLLGIVFGASSLYLVLKVGMTISASIPVAVISITLFRYLAVTFGFRKATILENNIVQTAGSAGESIAFGVGVTMPALLLMGEEMETIRVMTVAIFGGLLGILMMIPLRRGLIVEQHGKLTYPEGTACAEVLIVGEQGGMNALTVFSGFGLGALYKLFSYGLRCWPDTPSTILTFFNRTWKKGIQVAGEFSPELLGVGYIIGPATGCIMMAGAALSWLVIVPLIKMFGEALATPVYPGVLPIAQMDNDAIRSAYILYIGAGAVSMGGLISVFSSIPIIWNSVKNGISDLRGGSTEKKTRTEDDLPIIFVIIGSIALTLAIWLTPMLKINLVGAVMIMVFGFIFVTVSSRCTGEIGSSSNPISGMTVSTLLLTCIIFVGLGWTGVSYRVTALSIAAVVCIAASNGGTTSQDLKTGFLVGGTPRYQQLAILIGALTSALVIGYTLLALNEAATVYVRPQVPIHINISQDQLTLKEKLRGPEAQFDKNEYFVYYMKEATTTVGLDQGKYLLDASGNVKFFVDPGVQGTHKYHECNIVNEPFTGTQPDISIASLTDKEHLRGPSAEKDKKEYFVYDVEKESAGLKAGHYLVDPNGKIVYKVNLGTPLKKLGAPQANLFALMIDGILTQKLPGMLVVVGMFIALIMELAQVSSLPFAVGLYLPFSSSVPIFIGGLVRWLVDRSTAKKSQGGVQEITETETSPAVLFCSGLIAGGSIMGVVVTLIQGFWEDLFKSLDFSNALASLGDPDRLSTLLFLLMAFFIYSVGRQWILSPKAEAEPAKPA
ncbi:MAG: oligopeptide transporter, OPT family [Candidatus Riflebacteria bacterium]|nr:oligopeptide transporter, OPT family [Candidatus Riflebacteria bacterium]